MSHATMQELTDAVHGFAPRPDHVSGCDECRTLEARLEGELDLLRRAEARRAPAMRRRLSRAPLVYAAAVLLATLLAVVFHPGVGPTIPGTQEKKVPSLDELLQAALDGKEEALKELRSRGPAILRPLADARHKAGEAGSGAVADLMFELKKSAASADGAVLLGKLDAIRITVDLAGAPFDAAFDYFREITGIDFVTDPGAVAGPAAVTLKLADVPLRRVLDVISLTHGVELDARFGVILVSKPERLWAAPRAEAAPAPLTEAQTKAAREAIAGLGRESMDDREKSAAALRALGRAVIPLLQEHAKNADKEVASRCKDLIDALSPRLAGTLPLAAAWRSQKVAKEDEAIAKKLATMKLDINFAEAELADVVAFLRDFSGLNFLVAKGVEAKVSLKLNDQPLGNALELMTLPVGLDVKIDGGVVVIFEPKR
jgi:hypothetical protein